MFDRAAKLSLRRKKSTSRSIPSPAGLSTTPRKSGGVLNPLLRRPCTAGKFGPKDLAAIGITNQRETTVVWNKKTGKPIYNAIVWQDTRVAGDVAEFSKHGGQDRYRAKTGLPLATYFSGLKIRWILENVPGARDQAEAGDLICGTVDSFLIWKLTGRRSRHGCYQRQPHAIDESLHAAVGREHSARLRNSCSDFAEDCVQQ